MKTIFITGTDTGVGKTIISCGLVAYWVKQGFKTTGFKPVASGASWIDNALKNDDALKLHAASNTRLAYSMVNPYVFEIATAPHIAADLVDSTIELNVLDNTYSQITAVSDRIVIEGAGGWQVPLNSQASFADWVAAHRWPVLLVVNIKLGCINHARLSCLDIIRCGNPLVGWVANVLSDNITYQQQMISSIQSFIKAPLLGTLPPLDAPCETDISKFVDFSKIK